MFRGLKTFGKGVTHGEKDNAAQRQTGKEISIPWRCEKCGVEFPDARHTFGTSECPLVWEIKYYAKIGLVNVRREPA